MKPIKKTVTVNLNDDLVIDLTGMYYPPYGGVRYDEDGSGEPPEPAEFEIELIEIIKGTIKDYTNYVNDYLYSVKHLKYLYTDIWEHFENLAIEKIDTI